MSLFFMQVNDALKIDHNVVVRIIVILIMQAKLLGDKYTVEHLIRSYSVISTL